MPKKEDDIRDEKASGQVSWLQPWLNWRGFRFWLVVALAAYTLFGFFGLPRVLDSQITKTIEASGRTVSIEEIKTNPFVLSVEVNGLEIRDADGIALIRFDQFFTNLQLSSVFRWAWTLREFRLSGLHLEEERFDDENTRFLRFANELQQPENEIDEQDSAPVRLVIQSFELKEGSIGFTDQTAGGFHGEFGPVSISAMDLRTLPDHAGNKSVSIATPSGGVISWQGDLSLFPLASKGHLTVSGKGLPAALRYADHFLPVSIAGEQVDIAFDYQLANGSEGLTFAADNWSTKTGAIQVRMDNADAPFLTLDSIELADGKLRWPEQSVQAGSLAVNGLELDTWLDEQGALKLLEALPADSPTEKDLDGATPWTINLDRFDLTGARVRFEDRQPAQPGSFQLENIAATLRDFSLEESAQLPTELSFNLASGGDFSYAGALTLFPQFAASGRADLQALALTVVQPWLAQHLNVELQTGLATLGADLEFGPGSLSAQGTLAVRELTMQDTLRTQSLAALRALDIERFEFDSNAASIRTSPLMVTGAYGRIHIFDDLTTNLDGLVIEPQEQGGTAATPADDADRGFSITVAGIEVNDGSMDFADDSLPLPFSTAIGSMNGSISTLATDSSEPSTVNLQGRVNEFGEARVEGALNPWDFSHNSEISMIFRNLEMANLTPYTIQYAGYAIESGRLDLDLGYTLQARKLEGDNNIVIRELELGDKVEHPDAVSLPLKLAVALLKDSEGVIDVDLPISGDLDDPTFKVSGIVWQAIKNLLVKVVSAPFRLLGNLVGVDSEDFGTMEFQPGSAMVSPPDQEKLLKLAEAMQQRPELALVVSGVYAEASDRPALQAQALATRLEERRGQLLESGEADVIDADRPALESLFVERFPDVTLESVQAEHSSVPAGEEGEAPVLDAPAYVAALRQRLVEAQPIGEPQLQELARARAEAVLQALEGPEGERTLAVSNSGEVKETEAEGGAVPLELAVEAGEG